MVGKEGVNAEKKTKKKENEKENKSKEEGLPKEGAVEGEETKAETENSLVDEKRLFVMNLSYQVTKEEL